jgi:hypothetical protein
VHTEVVLRPLPKAVFLYPTFLATLAMGVVMHYWPEHGVTGAIVFLAILFVNLGVLALDFPGIWFVALFISLVAAGLAGFLIDAHVVEFLPWAISLGRNLEPVANEQFYFAMAAGIGIIFAVVLLLVIRFNYWTITANEITHCHGFGKSDNFPLPGPTMQKDLTDMFEFLLLRSGRLTIHLKDGPDIILENVPRINVAHRRIQTMMEATNVHVIDQYRHGHH